MDARNSVGEASIGFVCPCDRRSAAPPRREMGKEQELLEAARTGNLAAVEKLLSGKRQSAGSGAAGGGGSSGNVGSGGHSSSHPLSSLLR